MNRTGSSKVRSLVVGALIAAAYYVLSSLSTVLGLGHGAVQLRLGEALCLLPAFTPSAVSGLAAGCLLANLTGPLGVIDIVCGTVATLIAAAVTRALVRLKCSEWLLPLPCVVINGLVVGAELAIISSRAFFAVFTLNFLQVAIGQTVVCYGIGLPLYRFVSRRLPQLFE